MKPLGNVRKAFASKGDDVTLTRWIKEPGRHTGHRTAPMPASATGTRFQTRVLHPSVMPRLLVSGHSNVKIGRDVRKGRLRGYWIYTLSLEERATCPSSCHHWTDCYGNAMPFAKRIIHGPEMLSRLETEIAMLVNQRGREGILIRLHALGDFYSVNYVAFWEQMLARHERLAVFGYTAHAPDSEIGLHIADLRYLFGDRAMIRHSDSGTGIMSTLSIATEADCPASAFVCPEQTGKTTACATCALCWGTNRDVAFLAH